MLINLMCFATLFSFQKHKNECFENKNLKILLKKKDAKLMNINAFKTSLMKFHKKNHRLYCVFIFKFFCNIIAEYIFLKSILFNSFRDERCESLFSLKVENNSKKNVNIYFKRPKIEYIKYIYLAFSPKNFTSKLAPN